MYILFRFYFSVKTKKRYHLKMFFQPSSIANDIIIVTKISFHNDLNNMKCVFYISVVVVQHYSWCIIILCMPVQVLHYKMLKREDGTCCRKEIRYFVLAKLWGNIEFIWKHWFLRMLHYCIRECDWFYAKYYNLGSKG